MLVHCLKTVDDNTASNLDHSAIETILLKFMRIILVVRTVQLS